MLRNIQCRLSEALEMLDTQILLSEKAVKIETSKQRKKDVYRKVPLQPNFLNNLEWVHLIKTYQKVPTRAPRRLWTWSRRTAGRNVEKVMKTAGIEGAQACANGLRHSFAIHCLEKKIPLPVVSKWLGHATLTHTAIYTSVLEENEATMARQLWK